jgi:hypothetical protein
MNRESIARLWKAGRTYLEIAELLGTTKGTIAGHVKRMGLQRRDPESKFHKRYSGAIVVEMKRLHAEGKSLRGIAKILCIASPRTIWRHLNPVCPTPDARKSDPPRQSPVGVQSTGSLASILRRTAQTNHLRTTAKIRTVDPGPPPSSCSFPVGERPYIFCGKPSVKYKPFCEEHTARCYEKTRPLKIVPVSSKESEHFHNWGKW